MVGILKKKPKNPEKPSVPEDNSTPKPQLARRKMNRNSTIRSGRTIGERREKLETANERMTARKKDKRKKNLRIFFVSIFFIILIIAFVIVYFEFFHEDTPQIFTEPQETAKVYEPTIEIIDEGTGDTSKITNRMKEYIGQAEYDFKDLGYSPIKAVVPSNAIREVDFYLEGYSGFIKMVIDRGSAVSVEDADRMLRYLQEQGTTEFQYIDVRISGKAFWK